MTNFLLATDYFIKIILTTMLQHYRDYFWESGLPKGIDPLDPSTANISYKIIMDPYRKDVSVEKYCYGAFSEAIYDSRLLNFRHLKPEVQTAWQKEVVKESPTEVISLIRNQDDRVILKEICEFDRNVCRKCRSFSPQNILLTVQQVLYTFLDDPCSGMMLFDSNDHLVMYKLYELDQERHFTDLLVEEWEPQKRPFKTALQRKTNV